MCGIMISNLRFRIAEKRITVIFDLNGIGFKLPIKGYSLKEKARIRMENSIFGFGSDKNDNIVKDFLEQSIEIYRWYYFNVIDVMNGDNIEKQKLVDKICNARLDQGIDLVEYKKEIRTMYKLYK